MKKNDILSLSVVVILILVSTTGILEERASKFITSVMTKNLHFLALVEDIKLVIGGLSSIDVPFIKGISGNLNTSLDKTENFLLLTNVITFIQFMLISISKSWILKGLTLILFGLIFIKSLKKYAIKLLILTLAINPGLSIYSITVDKISHDAHIDFGDNYLKKLKLQVDATKKENATLMQEHAKDITRINNNQKGIVFFKKLKEDISYDFKKVENDIHGTYRHIRMLIHGAGHEMVSKIFSFCAMVIFSMLLLPIGYVTLIYFLFNIMFKGAEFNSLLNKTVANTELFNDKSIDQKDVKSTSLSTKIKKFVTTSESDMKQMENKIEHAPLFQEDKGILEKAAGTIKKKATVEFDELKKKIATELSDEEEDIKSKKQESEIRPLDDTSTEEKGNVKKDTVSKTSEIADPVNYLKNTVTDDVNNLKTTVGNEVVQTKNDLTKHISKEKINAMQQINNLKDSFNTEVVNAHKEIASHMELEKAHLTEMVNKVKQNISKQVAVVRDNYPTDSQDEDSKGNEPEKKSNGSSAIISI